MEDRLAGFRLLFCLIVKEGTQMEVSKIAGLGFGHPWSDFDETALPLLLTQLNSFLEVFGIISIITPSRREN